jgi:hypothetical protein
VNGEKLLEHLENLVPGLVTLTCLAWKLPATAQIFPNPTIQRLAEQPFIAGLTLVAFSYLVGVLVFLVSRLILDTVSALTLRPLLLKLYRWPEFGLNPVLINYKYREALDSVREKPESSSTRQEVGRRRQRGRLIRTLLVPAFVLLWPFRDGYLVLYVSAILLLAYSYSEVAIYQEARLARLALPEQQIATEGSKT